MGSLVRNVPEMTNACLASVSLVTISPVFCFENCRHACINRAPWIQEVLSLRLSTIRGFRVGCTFRNLCQAAGAYISKKSRLHAYIQENVYVYHELIYACRPSLTQLGHFFTGEDDHNISVDGLGLASQCTGLSVTCKCPFRTKIRLPCHACIHHLSVVASVGY